MSPAWLVARTVRLFGHHKLAFAAQAVAFAVVATLGLGARSLERASAEATARIAEQGHVIAYLEGDLPIDRRGALDVAIARLPGVASVRGVDSTEALARLRRDLQGMDQASAAALDGLEADFLPPSVEVSLAPGGDLAARTHDVATRLRRLAGVTAVDEMGEGRERLAAFAGLARRLASLIAASAAVAGLVLIGGLLLRVRARQAGACAVLAQLGATPTAVRVPEGIFTGTTAIAGALAALAVADHLAARLLGVDDVTGSRPLGVVVAAALAIGLGIGWLAVPARQARLAEEDGAP